MSRAVFTRIYYRSPHFDCGCHTPCRCDHRNNPTPKRIDAYREAVDHLTEHGLPAAALLPECRGLWSRGGADRTLAESLVRRWSA